MKSQNVKPIIPDSQALDEIKLYLGYISDIDIDLQALWKITQHDKITEESLPILLKSIMFVTKTIDQPNWVKRKVTIAVISAAIDQGITDKIAATSLKLVVPVLIDTFVEISNSKQLFKLKKTFIKKVCCT